MSDVEIGTHDLQLRLGVVEEPAEIGLAAGEIGQHLPPGVVELARQARAQTPSNLELEGMVLGEGVVSDHVAHEGVGIEEEIVGGQGGAEALAPSPLKKKMRLGARKPPMY